MACDNSSTIVPFGVHHLCVIDSAVGVFKVEAAAADADAAAAD